MAVATETSKLTIGEEEAMATARRLCEGYLKHRSVEVVNDGAQAGASTQTPCATTSWSRPSRVTGRPPYATSWEFAAGQRIRAEGHTAHNAKGIAGREPPAVPISRRHCRSQALPRPPFLPSRTPNDGGGRPWTRLTCRHQLNVLCTREVQGHPEGFWPVTLALRIACSI